MSLTVGITVLYALFIIPRRDNDVVILLLFLSRWSEKLCILHFQDGAAGA